MEVVNMIRFVDAKVEHRSITGSHEHHRSHLVPETNGFISPIFLASSGFMATVSTPTTAMAVGPFGRPAETGGDQVSIGSAPLL